MAIIFSLPDDFHRSFHFPVYLFSYVLHSRRHIYVRHYAAAFFSGSMAVLHYPEQGQSYFHAGMGQHNIGDTDTAIAIPATACFFPQQGYIVLPFYSIGK